ncbi:MAG: hypothetical protein QXQ96_02600 [Sulfolobales archaeon]
MKSSIRRVLLKLLAPRIITSEVVTKYVRKALRLGVWRELALEARALLTICRRLPKPVRSHTLAHVLSKIFLEIELAGLKGKALFYGSIEFLKKGMGSLKDIPSNAEKILCLGIMYLNNPPLMRFYS